MTTQETEKTLDEPMPTASTAALLSQQQLVLKHKRRPVYTRLAVVKAVKRGTSVARAATLFKVHQTSTSLLRRRFPLRTALCRITRKKVSNEPLNWPDERVVGEIRDYLAAVEAIPDDKRVYMDESFAYTNEAPVYGRSSKAHVPISRPGNFAKQRRVDYVLGTKCKNEFVGTELCNAQVVVFRGVILFGTIGRHVIILKTKIFPKRLKSNQFGNSIGLCLAFLSSLCFASMATTTGR
ncbi:hypothetical protein DFJ74DRAFT_640488 [Hyaloraphidium curvatum]|nr:hypothetical protein DFJ74DRAFT_640488 [Hyaloraphidium curvatum]